MNGKGRLMLAALVALAGYSTAITVYVFASHGGKTTIEVPMVPSVMPSTLGQGDTPSLEMPLAASRAQVEPEPPVQATRAAAPMGPALPDAIKALDTALFGKTPPFDGTDACFRSKYSGLSADQLKVAFAAVEQRVKSERKRISEDRMKAGLFEEHILPEGEKFPIATSTDGTPISIGFVSEPMDGFTLLKTTTIPADEYPEFRMLDLEDWWLHDELHKLGACDCQTRSNH